MAKDTLYFDNNEDIFFTADTHWVHRNIINYCQRTFSCIDEMDETLIVNWNKVIIQLSLLAFRMCKFFPELMDELKRTLEAMEIDYYKPAVKCARSRILSGKLK